MHAKCPKCDAIFSMSDWLVSRNTYGDGDTTIYFWCPQCRHATEYVISVVVARSEKEG